MQDRVPSATALILLSAAVLCAQDVTQAARDDDSGWVRAWIRVSDKAKASQPHFVAPIVTTHVMLVQQFRYDMSWQQDPSGGTVTSNYGNSRGLEIIPSSRLEVGIFPPAYVVHQANAATGFGDLSYQVKFRFFRSRGQRRLLCGILPWWHRSYW